MNFRGLKEFTGVGKVWACGDWSKGVEGVLGLGRDW